MWLTVDWLALALITVYHTPITRDDPGLLVTERDVCSPPFEEETALCLLIPRSFSKLLTCRTLLKAGWSAWNGSLNSRSGP